MYFLLYYLVLFCVLLYFAKLKRDQSQVLQFPACFFELPFIGSFYQFIGNSEDIMKTIVQVGSNTIKLGGASRVYGLNTCFLVFTDVNDVAEVLQIYLDKDNIFYKFLQEVTGNASLTMIEASAAKVRRQLMLPTFSSRMLNSFTDLIVQETVCLTDMLNQHVEKGPFCAGKYMSAFCMNTFISLANVEELKKEFCTFELCSDYARCMTLIVDRTRSLWMHPDCIYRFTSNYRETKERSMKFYYCITRGQEIRRNKILANEKSKGDNVKENKTFVRNGIFDSLLNSNLSTREISEEIVVLCGATEEASIAIGFTLILLGQYHAVQDKLYEELVNICGDSNRPLAKEDLNKMHYLEMVVKESLRLYPSVPIVGRTAHKDITLSSGKKVPAGTRISIPIISIHRNPKYWGPDAEHFDPERFSSERLKRISEKAFMPFSFGARGCPGYKLGMTMIKIGICAILRKYKVVDEPAHSPIPNIRTKFEMTSMKSVSDVEIKLESRL